MSTRWREVEALLDAALDRPWGDRPAFLDGACGDDEWLRREVEELLAACDAADEYLEIPAARAAAPLLAAAAEGSDLVVPGTRVGPYRVVGEAGRGGMGVVYVAERDDGAFTMRVALKLLAHRPGMEALTLRRFREERQMLATLEHPGIARILDGGVTSDGTPWFAMEYVEGTPIDRFCRAQSLDLARRLDLFVSVCEAVQHAHDHAIVHRDIKPSNILVRPDGAVKLLDFGIAKLTSLSDGDADRETTLPGFRPMTPDYASPEQLRGKTATHASDVYALGVLLYVMLADRHPWRDAGEGTALRVPRLDAAPHLPDGLPRSLDAIVGVAMEANPERRYPSVAALAADVRAVRSRRGLSALAATRQLGRSPLGTRAARVGVSVFLVAAAALLATALRVRRPTPRRADALAAVAVLPFATQANDPALARLSRDLVTSLSADLDGMGELHTVDAATVLARLPATGASSSFASDLATARALGATSVLRGALTREGDRTRVVATLRSLDDSLPLARASALTASGDAAAATDSLRTQLLRDLWNTRVASVPDPIAVTTHSASALRAYLAGERAVLQNRMPVATEAFSRAIEADSSFWYAYWRLAWAREFMDRSVDSAVSSRYLAHLGAIPERDRALIETRGIRALPERIASEARSAMRVQDYWPAALDYAHLVIHRGPYAGIPIAEAADDLDRALRLQPNAAPAWDDRMIVALSELDTLASAKALRNLERLDYDSAARAVGGMEMLVYYRYLDHLARHGGIPDEALAERVARLISDERRPDDGRFQGGMSRYGFHGARIDVGQRVLRLPSLRRDHVAFEWGEQATTWASRGAWDSAMVAADRATSVMPTPARSLFVYRLAAVGYCLGDVGAELVRARRLAAAAGEAALSAPQQRELAWVDGIVAATAGDREALGRARTRLVATRSADDALLDSSLAARQLDLGGRRRAAIAMLTGVVANRYGPAIGPHPYLGGMDRMLLSRWLREAGELPQAARLLVWHEALVSDIQTAHANALLAGQAYLDRARIEDASGQREMALADYRQFLRRYDLPAPARRAMVNDARARAARLAGPR